MTMQMVPVQHEMAAVLRTLGFSPDKPEVKALALVASRYQLDPVLREIILIGDDNKGWKPYVTRDGMIAVAHRHGQLNGIVVEEQRRNSTGDGWTAFVSVYRKDMVYPFRYGAQCRDNELQAKRGYGMEQAVARAERRALIRAFALSDIDDEPLEEPPFTVEHVAAASSSVDVPDSPPGPAELDPEPEPAARSIARTLDRDVASLQGIAHAAVGELTDAERKAFLDRHQIGSFGEVWPAQAVEDALGQPF